MATLKKQSAGLLMFRHDSDALRFFLVHPGGPYWVSKDAGSWTVPKGEYDADEEPLDAAVREFAEETGFTANAPFVDIGSIVQKNRKAVRAWAFAGDCDPSQLVSNTCEIEWPPRTRQRLVIPEVDRGAWFTRDEAVVALRAEQHPFLDRTEAAVGLVRSTL